MAIVPIEVVEVGDVARADVARAITMANSLQDSFVFVHLSQDEGSSIRQHAYRKLLAHDFLDRMEEARTTMRGYHPFLIAFVDAPMDGKKYANLFASARAEKGLAVVTTAHVADVILPGDRLVAYVLYYLARYALGFMCPHLRGHEEDRQCVFDRKAHKAQLLESMRRRPLCDSCRTTLLGSNSSLSPVQLEALDSLFERAGVLLEMDPPSGRSRPTAFIGSSVEGLNVARRLQSLLEHELDAVVWDQGTVFGLGDSTLEALESAVRTYDFGIFVCTPDDKGERRGETLVMARDNVLFELGMFVGRLTRRRAYIVYPRGCGIALPSDLKGITAATYDLSKSNLDARLGPAAEKVRAAVLRELGPSE